MDIPTRPASILPPTAVKQNPAPQRRHSSPARIQRTPVVRTRPPVPPNPGGHAYPLERLRQQVCRDRPHATLSRSLSAPTICQRAPWRSHYRPPVSMPFSSLGQNCRIPLGQAQLRQILFGQRIIEQVQVLARKCKASLRFTNMWTYFRQALGSLNDCLAEATFAAGLSLPECQTKVKQALKLIHTIGNGLNFCHRTGTIDNSSAQALHRLLGAILAITQDLDEMLDWQVDHHARQRHGKP